MAVWVTCIFIACQIVFSLVTPIASVNQFQTDSLPISNIQLTFKTIIFDIKITTAVNAVTFVLGEIKHDTADFVAKADITMQQAIVLITKSGSNTSFYFTISRYGFGDKVDCAAQ